MSKYNESSHYFFLAETFYAASLRRCLAWNEILRVEDGAGVGG
jgi:hypothetical protein